MRASALVPRSGSPLTAACSYLKSQHGYLVHTYETSFMPQGEKKQTRTFKAGRHTFPFSIELEPHLPSSLQVTHSTPCIAYKLRATAVRPPLMPNFTASWPVEVVRAFGDNSLEYQQTLEGMHIFCVVSFRAV